ncbi:hypothetical protein AAZX31_13G079100 [Glycine max]
MFTYGVTSKKLTNFISILTQITQLAYTTTHDFISKFNTMAVKSSKPNRERFMLSCFHIHRLPLRVRFNKRGSIQRRPPKRISSHKLKKTTTSESSSPSSPSPTNTNGGTSCASCTARKPPSRARRWDVKFVFCNLTKEDQKVLVALEIMRYNDIIVLNCTENMNKGKTSTFFTSLPEIFNNETTTSGIVPYPPYHYVMKADDDTYVRLNSLVRSLRPLPREDLYYGFVIPCGSMDPFKHYMSGMGFVVSWDIVEWIHGSDIPRKHVEGPEDKVFGDWMRWARRGNNRFNAKWSMYNYPDPPSVCSHDLWNDTIAVHLFEESGEVDSDSHLL